MARIPQRTLQIPAGANIGIPTLMTPAPRQATPAPRVTPTPAPRQATPAPRAPQVAALPPAPQRTSQQQMSDALSEMTRTLTSISAGLGVATPAQRAQLTEVLGGAGTILGGVQRAMGGTPTPQPAQPTPVFEQTHEDRMRTLLGQYERALTAQPPAPTGLLPEERGLFDREGEQLRARYDAALDALRRKQTEEKQRLIGRYAAMGFTEPGVIAGPMAGEPGIVTEGVLRKREGQRRELADLEMARAGDILALTRAEQEAGRRARAEELDAFTRRQEATRRNLEGLLQLAQPERFTAGGRIFERDLITGEARDITPPEALRQQVEVQRGGRRLQVTLDDEGREIGAVDLGPIETRRAASPEVRNFGTDRVPNWRQWNPETGNWDDLVVRDINTPPITTTLPQRIVRPRGIWERIFGGGQEDLF